MTDKLRGELRHYAETVLDAIALYIASAVGLAIAASSIAAGWILWEPFWEAYIRQPEPAASAPAWVLMKAGAADSLMLIGPMACFLVVAWTISVVVAESREAPAS